MTLIPENWRTRLPRLPGRRRLLTAAVAALWVAGLLGLALPAWQRSLRMHREIETVDRDLDELEHWSVAGIWLEQAVLQREPAVAGTWSRLFPAERQREQLFLDLAGIADRSGVSAFALAEITRGGMPIDMPGGYQEQVDDAPPPMDDEATGPIVPVAKLDSYRVRARFEGGFDHTAAFLGGLRRIERAVNVTSLVIRPSGSRLAVEMELDVYVAEPTGS